MSVDDDPDAGDAHLIQLLGDLDWPAADIQPEVERGRRARAGRLLLADSNETASETQPTLGHIASTAFTASASLPAISWPSPLGEPAFHGLAGEIVRLIEPHTEADTAAVLVQLLVCVGSAFGRHCHFTVGADRHYANLFANLVGASGKSRKGTGLGMARAPLAIAEPLWDEICTQSGLSSGEGLIWAVRDAVTALERSKGGGAPVEVVVDEGARDRRLLVVEEEFASVLRNAGRQGNNLSSIIRNAWSTGNLQLLTKNSPIRATSAHISILGHITRVELLSELTRTDTANGLANRFLWICSRRSKRLPDGGDFHTVDLMPHARRLTSAITHAQQSTRLERDDAARTLWHDVYDHLTDERPGLYGAVTGRAEAQTMRLALIYALLDESSVIRASHLEAALEVWRYADESARWIFGDKLGNPIADRILAMLDDASSMTRTEIRDAFGRNVPAEQIGTALALLHDGLLAEMKKEPTAGRPTERWRITRDKRHRRGKGGAA